MKNSGNTTASLLLAHALADTKRHVFFTHVSAKSSALETYLGLADYEDKTSTPTQLVKLMREGAIKVEDIGDFCKNDVEFLHIFTNNRDNFLQDDMHTLVDYISSSPDSMYEYMVFDIDASLDNETAQLVLKKSDIVVVNLSASTHRLDQFKEMEPQLVKLFNGKKVITLVNQYDQKVMKLKEVTKYLGAKTTPYTIRYNPWVQWSCNKGKLSYLYLQGKVKDADVIDVFRDITTLASGVSKAKVAVIKQRQKEGKPVPTPRKNDPKQLPNPKSGKKKGTESEEPKEQA